MKKHLYFILLLFAISGLAQERPNVLFLVIEDTSPYLFPAYGNTSISTPNLDWLANNGVVFDNAFANAPYCSPARSTLISGTQATVYGNDIHRQGHVQKEQYFLVKKLRDAGYFTVNKTKTDYNISGKETHDLVDKTWSMNGKGASYNDPSREGKPFFGQFNNVTTHMSRLTTVTIDERLKCKVDPNTVNLPPQVPDLPEVRADYALHLEGVQDIDKWVGVFLDDLKEKDLFDNTIIFFFSDHGGCLPRGKAFPFDTGYRVPLIVYAPKQYEKWLPAKPGERTERMVSFDDFIPTAMSLAGLEKPDYVTGKPFMGTYNEEPRDYVYTFRTNTGGHFDSSRSVFDKRYQYIKYYTPHKRHALTQTFQWQMPAQLAWDAHYMAGKASEEHSRYYEPHPVEALYDLKNDPWEAHNLAENPDYQDKLKELREANATYIRENMDLGFLSWEKRQALTDEGLDPYSWVRETNYPLTDLISLAEKASTANADYLPEFIENLSSARPSFRFWAISGILNLAHKDRLKSIPDEVYTALSDEEDKDISALAAETLVRAGDPKRGFTYLTDHFEDNSFVYSSLENLWDLNTPITEELKGFAANAKSKEARTYARSLLIKLSEMNISELFDESDIKSGYKTYRNRVSNYIQNTPALND